MTEPLDTAAKLLIIAEKKSNQEDVVALLKQARELLELFKPRLVVDNDRG